MPFVVSAAALWVVVSVAGPAEFSSFSSFPSFPGHVEKSSQMSDVHRESPFHLVCFASSSRSGAGTNENQNGGENQSNLSQ
ncbi:hypothetical protein EYF80_048522 [Liparis tanakae]|uniref:Secreted protein n=1 Tax=Liparis tanakae TaxID=230148 RepID=A0A4Z2FJJ9_9TELE|nr:hypothetical protein EYF80_048522 [Liparis tanakae]